MNKTAKNGSPNEGSSSVTVQNSKYDIGSEKSAVPSQNQTVNASKSKCKPKTKKNGRNKSSGNQEHTKDSSNKLGDVIDNFPKTKSTTRVAVLKPHPAENLFSTYKCDPLKVLSKISKTQSLQPYLLTQSLVPEIMVCQLTPALYTKSNREPGTMKQFLNSARIPKLREAKTPIYLNDEEVAAKEFTNIWLPKLKPTLTELIKPNCSLQSLRKSKLHPIVQRGSMKMASSVTELENEAKKLFKDIQNRTRDMNIWNRFCHSDGKECLLETLRGIKEGTIDKPNKDKDGERSESGGKAIRSCKKQVQWNQEVDVIYYSNQYPYNGVLERCTERLREEWEQQERSPIYPKNFWMNSHYLDSWLLPCKL